MSTTQQIAIIGAGRVGGALAEGLHRAGHVVRVGVRSPDDPKHAPVREVATVTAPSDACDGAAVVILATPSASVADLLPTLPLVEGQVVLDATNQVRGPVPGGHPTMWHLVSASVPSGVAVAKAFNTIGAEHLAHPRLEAGPAMLPVAGDPAATAIAAELGADLGFEPLVVGGPEVVDVVEAHARLWISLAFGGLGRDIGFVLSRRADPLHTTPLPEPGAERLGPPDAAEVQRLTDGVLAAIEPPGGHTEFQQLLIKAAFESLTGHAAEVEGRPSIDAASFARSMADRNEAFRTRILQTMILGALVLRPLPAEVADRVERFARALSIDDGMLRVARRFAEGQLALAAVDFDRNGYTSDWSPERAESLHTSSGLDDAWATAEDDPALAARWEALEDLPAGTLGRRMWEFYRARGFAFPGQPGSAPPLLAQHDWVHLLADFGTKVESELEVFAFIARANDDPRGFALLAMVVSLFETGYLAEGAGLFEAFPGQLSREGMAVRVADALRRGALSHGMAGEPDVDFLAVDWLALAPRPIEELRDAFGIVPKAAAAVEAGSVGPWEPGGISEYQHRTAQESAAAQGVAYEAYGATP